MKFYHGTSEKNWKNIKHDKYLWNYRGEGVSRCTYLTNDLDEAKMYGEVLLEVEYNPELNPKMNNYNPDSWQFRCYEPIPLKNIKRLN